MEVGLQQSFGNHAGMGRGSLRFAFAHTFMQTLKGDEDVNCDASCMPLLKSKSIIDRRICSASLCGLESCRSCFHFWRPVFANALIVAEKCMHLVSNVDQWIAGPYSTEAMPFEPNPVYHFRRELG